MKYGLMAVALLLVVSSCAPRVTVDANQRVNFSKYRTYAWMDSDVKGSQNPLYYNQLASDAVENTVNQVLSEKGLKEVKSRPDLIIGYHFFVEEKTRTVATNNYAGPLYGPYYGWGRWGFAGWGPSWWGWGGPQYREEEYQAGTVVVDMVDARTKQLVWRGSVQQAVNDPARITSLLPKEIERIVERYPQRNS